MKAYKIEILVIDHDRVGEDCDELVNLIENASYPNCCVSPIVMAIQEADIGEWNDDHPLNKSKTMKSEYAKIFAKS